MNIRMVRKIFHNVFGIECITGCNPNLLHEICNRIDELGFIWGHMGTFQVPITKACLGEISQIPSMPLRCIHINRCRKTPNLFHLSQESSHAIYKSSIRTAVGKDRNRSKLSTILFNVKFLRIYNISYSIHKSINRDGVFVNSIIDNNMNFVILG